MTEIRIREEGAGTTARPSAAQPQPRSLCSQELFRNDNTVCIEHAGQTYWLRLTRSNKLILTK